MNRFSITILSMLSILAVVTACNDDDIPDNFYSSTKVTAAGFIEADEEQYGEFHQILDRANYFSMLATYGEYTLFLPNNAAVDTYLSENGYSSVDDIPLEMCDTLARTHIVKTVALFTTDISGESMPMNMNDRYIELSTDSDVTNNNALIVYVNKRSRIIEKDDSVTNGVVHVIDRMLTASNQFLPDLMEEDPQLTIFCEALRLTGMADSISKYLDETYTCGDDSVTKGVQVKYSTGSNGQANLLTAYFPEKRYFKYSAFVETDSIYRLHGINNLDDLKAYAKQVYDQSYPEDAGLYDDDFKNRKNPLNRFVSYHLINRIGLYEDWVTLGTILENCHITNVADPEDYYETMAPHSIMRFCYASDQLYINRKGVARNASVRGVRVLKREESGGHQQSAMNGVYHYIDDILTYSDNVRNNVLNRRLRIDGTTMSPDFMNANARVHWMEQSHLTGFKNAYVTDWKMSDETFVGVHSEQQSWWSYEGNAICVSGIYDISMKLPPVPFSGTWEIRMGFSQGEDRGVAQVYLNNEPCGIPVSFRHSDTYSGWEADTEDEDYNLAVDKAMRTRGFMKAMDSYGGDTPFRNRANTLVRRILTKQYLSTEQDYWLRFRQVLDDENLYMSFDYIELCPKSVYDSPEGEDRH
ncbi:MAG: fasciclin domain-containing protein [Prevotella sp.]|nr:fasciclin domain-containing protein [Prevotella sp.]